jgi:hypothetical protein
MQLKTGIPYFKFGKRCSGLISRNTTHKGTQYSGLAGWPG